MLFLLFLPFFLFLLHSVINPAHRVPPILILSGVVKADRAKHQQRSTVMQCDRYEAATVCSSIIHKCEALFQHEFGKQGYVALIPTWSHEKGYGDFNDE